MASSVAGHLLLRSMHAGVPLIHCQQGPTASNPSTPSLSWTRSHCPVSVWASHSHCSAACLETQHHQNPGATHHHQLAVCVPFSGVAAELLEYQPGWKTTVSAIWDALNRPLAKAQCLLNPEPGEHRLWCPHEHLRPAQGSEGKLTAIH
jgi:hypothetical protein